MKNKEEEELWEQLIMLKNLIWGIEEKVKSLILQIPVSVTETDK